MRRLFLAVLVVLGAAGTAAAQSPCPNDFQGRTAAVTCTCSAEATRTGPVWGSDFYTSDSRICRAALHAGVIPADGGIVSVEPAPGQPSYTGNVSNGVTSSNYGPWGASFIFGHPIMTTPDCPGNFSGRTEPLNCICSPSQTASGTVWGTGIYTADSAVCRAARHAGMVGPSGGAVTILPRPGQPQYVGSQANGVTSSNYGTWGASFTFQR